MGNAATAQINVRIDRALKDAGDAELERLGISPSQIVRDLWEKLARGGEESAKARRALAPESPTSSEYERKLAALERYEKSWEQLAKKLDLDLSSFAPMSEEEMREARYEQLLEKYGE